MTQVHIKDNIWKSTTEQPWAGGKIIITEYEQKFKETSYFWYKYVVKRSNGTIVEESKKVSCTLRTVTERTLYFQSLTEEECKEMRECDERFGRKKSYLPGSDVKAWAVS
jgi:hypothetical protein